MIDLRLVVFFEQTSGTMSRRFLLLKGAGFKLIKVKKIERFQP